MSVVSKLVTNSSDDDQTECVDWKLPLTFTKKRHLEKIEGVKETTQTWRAKERMKTVSVALVLCLNVGIDPPDILKTEPCSRMECWIDPLSTTNQKALETIGMSLQKQYEKWQPRARYKQSLDPTADELKKLCMSLRKSAKDERVLFHYNGHGVPKPTTNGEIWVFNKSFTQYIPLNLYDLMTWLGAPAIYVYDCSCAGTIIQCFNLFAEQLEGEYNNDPESSGSGTSAPAGSYKNCIQLAACGANQILPMNPDLPADLFTSCLTTPIKVALRWYVMQSTSKLVPKISLDFIDKIPGQLNDRRTMLGELNWIFTAITDTIAWNTLPREVFQRLFRQDLLVASLFRNFLLAERVMRSYDCTPVSFPKLPTTYQHPMWQAWDLALDLSLTQLPGILEHDEPFVHSPFFEEQLTAFQVWLDLGAAERNPPEQLPIVLQVLLSQVHRLRALELLGRFLDLGPWAVNLALSVGIFPYVLKLLQSSAKELRPLLVFIWAKILAVDNTCQADLVRENGHKYFLSVLQDQSTQGEHRTLAAFVLACIVNNYQLGQEAGLTGSLVSICLEQLGDPNPQLRQWVAICLARLWDNYDRARWTGVRDTANEKLYVRLDDNHPEVRAAVVYALGTFISSTAERTDHSNAIDQGVATMLLTKMSQDMSPIVRQELVVAMQWIILLFEASFLSVALSEEGRKESPLSPSIVVVADTALLVAGKKHLGNPPKRVSSSSSISSLGNDVTPTRNSSLWGYTQGQPTGAPFCSIYKKLWQGMTMLEKDPHPSVRSMCHDVLERIRLQVKELHSTREAEVKVASVSLPPSPSSRSSYLSAESPPTSLTTSVSDWSCLTPRSVNQRKFRKTVPNTITEETDESGGSKKPIVSTNFVAWRSKHFAQPVMKVVVENDLESKSYYEREWRYLRNAALRQEAAEELKKNVRPEHLVLNSKCPDQPKVILFHPYETYFAVAARDHFGIWDWNSGSKICYVSNRGHSGTKISSLQWINAHDVTLLLTGSDDGTVRVWGNYITRDGRDMELRTAWQALTDITTNVFSLPVGMVTAWDQRQQQLMAAGDSPKIRLWDAETEKKIYDLSTGTESCVTSLSNDPSNGSLLAAGFGDGTVRLFDRRQENSRVVVWREHQKWVVGVHLRASASNRAQIISGSLEGDVRIFDSSRATSKACYHCTPPDLTALAVHDNADLFCCGSANYPITLYRTDGNLVHSIKYQESFMGPRLGPVNCLALHPYRTALAAGNTDGNLSVYIGDSRR